MSELRQAGFTCEGVNHAITEHNQSWMKRARFLSQSIDARGIFEAGCSRRAGDRVPAPAKVANDSRAVGRRGAQPLGFDVAEIPRLIDESIPDKHNSIFIGPE